MMYDHYYKVPVNTECRPSVVDDITVKHTVLDDINFKLKVIEAKTTAVMMAQGSTPPTPFESRLEKKISELQKDLVTAYKDNQQQKTIMEELGNELAEAQHTIAALRKESIWSFMNEEGLKVTRGCGGNNSYTSIKTGVASHGEMTTTVRTNLQEIANGNGTLDQYGYMWGKWIKKNADSYFLSGLFKALAEGG